ncbi:TonB-dependent receptor [Fulvivirga maritima]|uniref:TonB-dependent receptor plug domain-containing protein n=1 Tax=Fulvivirga maritima TaxID=2904247 RepID=UPI001F2917C4|nr:TonB-dependent receptor [Fulvivirga maritima]UII27700.1 TonB-dependent receptor [Fulvivirga maritima]
MRNFFCLIFLSACCYTAYGQDTTAVTLQEVRIEDKRIQDFQTGEKIETVSSQYLKNRQGGNMAELLTKAGGLNIRSYGVGGLSTPSVRGTGSNHTPVMWEGLNLQSPMNGSLDLTLVPVSFIDNVAIQYGGSGSVLGSGALGGAIHINTDLKNIHQGVGGSLFQQFGSFGKQYTGLNLSYGKGIVKAKVRAFTHQADNDFEFFNRFNNREEEMDNAQVDQRGVMSEWYFDLPKSQSITAKYWYQYNDIHLPNAASLGGKAIETQTDEFHRAVVHYQNNRPKGVFEIRSGLVNHYLNYKDYVAPASISKSNTWINDIHKIFRLKPNHELQVGFNYTYDQAETESYGSNIPDRHRLALFVGSKWLLMKKLEVNLMARQSYIDDELVPFLPSLGLQYFISPEWQTKTKVARSYRVPTFNDLYWTGSGATGNLDLIPEEGWSVEQGFIFQKANLQAEFTGFYNVIDNWIQWVPRGSIWLPENVEQLQSRGVELSLKYHYNILPNWSLQATGKYAYTKATKEKVGSVQDETQLHKQTIYTPENQASVSLSSNYKNLSLVYLFKYTGEQATTGDNTLSIDAFATSDLSLVYMQSLGKHSVSLSGSVKNMLDQAYEIRSGRPMPGRHYQISIQYQFN